jgi:hypothetical protein
MREQKTKRKYNRSAVWKDVIATLTVSDPRSSKVRRKTIKGGVKDMGAKGMFLLSPEEVPIGAKAKVVIEFDPEQPGRLSLRAEGETVRHSPEGVGIFFTSIDLRQFLFCITEKINGS